MSKFHIATIVTVNHIDKAYTMLESMRQFHDCHLHILYVNSYHDPIDPPENENVTFYRPDDIFEGAIGRINRLSFSKYAVVEKERPPLIAPQDYLRWSLKPGFVHSLLEQHEMVLFCDCDLHFFRDFEEITEFAADKSIAISPHWRTIHSVSTDEIQYNFRHGLYNGGFFIATQKGKSVLEWWAERCCVECSADSETTYVDQKYLDLVPLYFDDVGIIRHKGCNVAAWNANYLKREVVDDDVLVGGDPIIFIHFSPITVRWINNGMDLQLADYLREYNEAIGQKRVDFYRQNKTKYMSAQVNTTDVI